MSNTHHSLSLKVIGFVLVQNGILAALLFHVARDATPLETSVIIGTLSVSAIVTVLLSTRMIGALKTLTSDISGLAEGRASIDPKHLRRDDEIGAVARELERLSRENLTRLVEDDEERDRRNKEEAERHDRHARDLKAANGRTEVLKEVVDSLDCAMRRFATGDFGTRLDMHFPDELEGLRADFNHAMTSVQETFERIESGARLLHSTSADVKDDSTAAMQRGLTQIAALAKTAADVGSLAETLRARKMQAEHTATIAYNARIDMRRPRDAMHTAAHDMACAQEAALKIEPVAKVMREIAFEANMLAMNAGIGATQEEARHAGATAPLATSIRLLAERAAEAAREISLLSRQSAEGAERGNQSIGKAEAELDAMAIYVDALKGHLDSIATSSTEEIEKVAAIKLSVMALAKNGRDQGIALETLAARTDRIMREIAAIDHHASRFTPVTVIAQGGVTMPESMKPPKRGSHLRLVK